MASRDEGLVACGMLRLDIANLGLGEWERESVFRFSWKKTEKNLSH